MMRLRQHSRMLIFTLGLSQISGVHGWSGMADSIDRLRYDAHTTDRRLSVVPHGTTNNPGIETMLWLRKGFGFGGAWTVREQNRLLSVCFGLPQVSKA